MAITIPVVLQKYLKVVVYLLVSGGLGYVSAAYVANDPALTAVFAPAINFVLFAVKQELDKEGIVRK